MTVGFTLENSTCAVLSKSIIVTVFNELEFEI